ncbi:hypothetical protein LK994_03705 [Ferruginibacter lapsinanis]|uniref:Wzz/FepE/Etk N-terminal domain-containing protein n=1 Tax=Ferruginibacter lapsinanis TaxID=563172 RepID=UPI001E56481C|nr:Wzz/FepE/Etk N-terminal domain-containing protein [Ferruginibacter lapsinanis]UEG50575.1 hypothetical protein LK994_03705 [Ferruginibacter lapsinanis]
MTEITGDKIGASSDKGSQQIMLVEQIKSWVNIIKKKWWLFALVGLLAGIVGFFYAKSQKPKYQSRLTFALDDGGSEGGLGGALSLAAQFGLNLGGGKDVFAGENILEILKSRRMIERVLLSVDTFENKPTTLIEFFIDQSDLRTRTKNPAVAAIHFPVGQTKETFTYLQDSVLYATYIEFTSNFIVAQKPDRKLNIFEVNVTNTNEKFAKDFTDRLVNETNSFYIELSSKKSRQTLEILEQRVASMKGNLNSSISSKAATQDANLNPAFAQAQVPILQQQVNMQVYGGAYGEMFKNLELARFQYLKEVPLMQIIDAADYPMKKIKKSKLVTAVLFSIISVLVTFFIIWALQLFNNANGQKNPINN